MKIENIYNDHHITFDAKALLKFEYLMKAKYNYEFTAFLHAERRADDEFHIFDVFFPRQDNTAVTTECDSDDIIALMDEGADVSMLCGHAHSHVDMDVFPSGTDEKDIKERAKDGLFNAAVIINKKGEMYGHIVDMETGHYYKDVPVFITYPFEHDEFKAKVVELAKQQDKLEDIATIIKMDKWSYYEITYPLTEDEIEELEDVLKNKFKFKYASKATSFNYGNKKKEETTKNQIKPSKFIDSLQKDDIKEINDPYDYGYEETSVYGNYGGYSDYIKAIEDEYDASLDGLDEFTDEELELWEKIKNKSHYDLTHEEWLLYEKMYDLRGY